MKSACGNGSIRFTHRTNKHPHAHHVGMWLAMPTNSKMMHTPSQQASLCTSCEHAAHPDSILTWLANCIFCTKQLHLFIITITYYGLSGFAFHSTLLFTTRETKITLLILMSSISNLKPLIQIGADKQIMHASHQTILQPK